MNHSQDYKDMYIKKVGSGFKEVKQLNKFSLVHHLLTHSTTKQQTHKAQVQLYYELKQTYFNVFG